MRSAVLLALVSIVALQGLGEEPGRLPAVWDAMRRDDQRTALAVIEQLPPADAETRRVRLAAAASRLNLQPFTQANVAEALRGLELLYEERADDPAGIYAAYLAGRARTLFLAPADPEGAEVLLWRLIALQPTDPVAHLAWLQGWLPRLYAAASEPEFEAITAKLFEHRAVIEAGPFGAEMYLVLGNAALRREWSIELAGDHLWRAREIGVTAMLARSDMLASLVQISIARGRPDDARSTGEEFLREFPRDKRAYTIRTTLAQLERGVAEGEPDLLRLYDAVAVGKRGGS